MLPLRLYYTYVTWVMFICYAMLYQDALTDQTEYKPFSVAAVKKEKNEEEIGPSLVPGVYRIKYVERRRNEGFKGEAPMDFPVVHFGEPRKMKFKDGHEAEVMFAHTFSKYAGPKLLNVVKYPAEVTIVLKGRAYDVA